ncbi:tachylectin-related carbohydrate-binding protein [Lentzea sp. JNUCC 0626]|uniref:tachylectin-related carbohydrate-binding protein n=1 Tax=Lentzea sp. JNUCC 0626 TaxID=3367513 RepID=UPI00374A35BB
MTRPERGSWRRWTRVLLAAAVGIAGLPVLMSGANVAHAVDTIFCKPTGNVFVSMNNSPGLNLRTTNEPSAGYNQWTDQGIGWGWDFHFSAGPDGYIWFTLDNGELRRHRWIDGVGWADNGISKLIATGWGGWNLPQFRNRFTVDSTNTLYTVDDSGSLKQHKYNETTGQMATKVIEAGWGKYDVVFAAGAGVLYARDPAVQGGTLYRYQYDDASGTFTQREKNIGWGWNGYKQITSPGGDIIYGTFPGGETWWYRWIPESAENPTGRSERGGSGEWKQKISTWGDVDEIAPAVDTCSIKPIASDVVCKQDANMWGSSPDAGLYLKKYLEPESGLTAWDHSTGRIGNGWNNMRFIAGPDGYKYLILADGKVARHRWIEGVGWDNGGVSKEIATGWTGWTDPRYINRITVDTNNHFYAALANGQLQHSTYTEAPGTGAVTWTQEVIDDGWGKYDQVFAAGDGVLYARDPNIGDGTLFRFHYDYKNKRWIEYGRNVGTGWNGYTQILSPGADIVIGHAGPDTWWYRFDNATKSFTNGAENTWKEYIIWWEGLQQMMIDVDACKLKNPEKITPPQTPAPGVDKAEMIYNAHKSRFEIAFADENGSVKNYYQQVSNSEWLTVNPLSSTGYTGRATLAQQEDNKIVVMARGTNAQTKAFVEPAPNSGTFVWSQKDVKGALNTSPILVRGNNKLLTAFALDGNNKLWFAEQFGINGEFKPWRQATAPDTYNMSGEMTIVPSGDGFEIAYTSVTNVVAVKKFVNGALSPHRVASGITAAGAPAAVVFADGKVQLVVRANDNKLYTQKEGASGFAGWTNISGAVQFTGSPEALLNKFNIVEVVARDTNGGIHRGGQTAPGSTTWRVWHYIASDSQYDVSFAAGANSEQRIFADTGNGNYILAEAPPYASEPNLAMSSDAATSLEKSSRKVPANATEHKLPEK